MYTMSSHDVIRRMFMQQSNAQMRFDNPAKCGWCGHFWNMATKTQASHVYCPKCGRPQALTEASVFKNPNRAVRPAYGS